MSDFLDRKSTEGFSLQADTKTGTFASLCCCRLLKTAGLGSLLVPGA